MRFESIDLVFFDRRVSEMHVRRRTRLGSLDAAFYLFTLNADA